MYVARQVNLRVEHAAYGYTSGRRGTGPAFAPTGIVAAAPDQPERENRYAALIWSRSAEIRSW